MVYTVENFKAGLLKLRKEGSKPYTKAVIAYNDKIDQGKSERTAISETLAEAAIGLAPSVKAVKLKSAREAAGLKNPLQNATSVASTATTTIIAQAKRVKLPTHAEIEKRKAAKVRALKDPSTPIKARKGPIIGWTLAGIPVGLAVTFLVQGVLLNVSGGDGSFPWVPFLIYPFVIPFFAIFGYRKAISPRSTDDSEDGPYAASTAHHSA